MTAMTELSSSEIRARLTTLQEAEDAHAARDFDSELANALSQGGDVDDLERQHLDAERQARRHRVERAALESALPQALAREAVTGIELLRAQADELKPAAIKARDKALRAATALESALAEWAEAQATGAGLANQARSVAKVAGIEPGSFGVFVSAQISALPQRLIGVLHELAGRESQRTAPGVPLD